MRRRSTVDELHYRVLLELGEDLPADRLCSLLQAVDHLGSIRRAAAELSLSYRYAWGLVKQAEGRLGAPLLVKRVGGAEGGGATLTETARDLVERHRQFRLQVEAGASRALRPAALGDSGPARSSQPLLLATTIGPVETGVLPTLEEAFHAETGLLVRHIAAGSGQALDIAREGRADLVLVHAPELEERFLAEGWGDGRYPLMYNDFLLLGPANDPAGVADAGSVTDAFRRIAAAGVPFVSRGDRSGTHIREVALWKAAGVAQDAAPSPPWYQICPHGYMGTLAAIRWADRQGGYLLADRATWLTARGEGAMLRPLREGDPALRNDFVLIPISPQRHPWVQRADADHFIAWATGPGGQALIAGFGVDRFGEPLFRPVRIR